MALLVDLVFGDRYQQAELAMRLQTFLFDLGLGALTEAQEQVRRPAEHRIAALAQDAFRDTEHLQLQLRWLANQLEDREVQAKRAVTEDFGLGENALGGTPTYGGIESLSVDDALADHEGLDSSEGV